MTKYEKYQLKNTNILPTIVKFGELLNISRIKFIQIKWYLKLKFAMQCDCYFIIISL